MERCFRPLRSLVGIVAVIAGSTAAIPACDSASAPDIPDSTEVSPPEGRECDDGEPPPLTAVDVAPDATFDEPVYATGAPGDDETLYVVERGGRIVRLRDGSVLEEPFLDIADRVDTSFLERGLLGLAFHPEYDENGRFFVHYTPAASHRVVIAEYRRAGADGTASPEEVRRLVSVRDPEDNHNGGMLTFGPDGMLYASIGDGGGAGDAHGPIGNALDVGNVFGTLLRLDVDAPDRDFAAADNPFLGSGRGDGRIWHFGLRNAWRFSFDAETGDLYIGDVGQDDFEELNVLPGGQAGGVNFGWRAYEGSSVYDSGLVERIDGHREPLLDYPLQTPDSTVRGGCSIVGGYVYRGDAIPELRGFYLYGDHCSSDVAALRWCGGGPEQHRRLSGLGGEGGLASFGEGPDGELYLVYVESGEVRRIEER